MLTGDLAEFGAADILGMLGHCRVTGALLVEGDGTAVLYCNDGDLTFATTRAGSGLADVLVATRFLDADDWAEAAVSDDPATSVAKALAAKGADLSRVNQVLQARTEEVVFEVALWRAGSFRFEPGADHALGNAFRFPFGDLLEAVDRRRERWDDLVDRFGSLDHVVFPPRGIDDRDEDDALLLSRTQVRVLTAAAAQVSVRDLADDLELGLFATCEVVAALLDRGLLVTGDVAPLRTGVWDPAPNSGISFAHHSVQAIDDVGVPAAANGHDGDGYVNGNGHHANGHHANGHVNGADERVAVAPNGAEFVAPGDAPARDLILRLLTAVKEL